MFEAHVGHSNDPDGEEAIREVIASCESQLGDRSPDAGILFAAIDFDHDKLVKAIRDRWPGIRLSGCTTDGEISSALNFQQDSLVLMLFCSDVVSFGSGIGRDVGADPEAAARRAVDMACQGLDAEPALCVLLPESLTADSLRILRGVRDALPPGVPVAGGLAADQWRFEKTFQICDDTVASDAVSLMVMAGPLHCSHGVASGWQPIGDMAKITRSEGNDVIEIDGQPALSFYRERLGAHEPSSNYPLAVYENDQVAYLRAPSGEFDEATGSVGFFAEVPQGAQVRMSQSTRDEVLDATRASMQQALASYPGKRGPNAALYFSCASRRQLLGTRTREEYEHVRQVGDTVLPAAGFYTNGEISPLSGRTDSLFHNETFITLLLGTDS